MKEYHQLLDKKGSKIADFFKTIFINKLNNFN